MVELTDELIMAYVDGELDKGHARDIKEAIEKDPEALKRVDIFRDSAALLQGVYDAPLHEPVPERLIRTVKDRRRIRPMKRINDFIISFLPIPKWQSAYGMALFLVLFFGITVGYLASSVTSKNDSFPAILSSKGFSRGLETTISGHSFLLADNAVTVTPVATFKDRVGRYCRQYEVALKSHGRQGFAQGIAWRNRAGEWKIWIYMASALPGNTLLTQNIYVPAGKDDPFNDILNKLMASSPMTRKQEEKLIGRDWK